MPGQESARQAVRHNPALRQFELEVDGGAAIAVYRDIGNVMVFTHTETPSASRGKGVAAELVRGALNWAREHGRKVKPECSYVVAYLKRHPEFSDLTR